MIPILYSEDETAYISNGIGRLADIIDPKVTENMTTGDYTLEFSYPTDGIYAEEIRYNRTIKCFNNGDPQLFDIHDISDNDDGTMNVFARHIKHRLFGIPVSNYTAQGVAAALAGITTNALITPGFEFYTDKTSNTAFTFAYPTDAGHLLRGIDGSILDVYGGEYYYDNFRVSLLERRGADSGVEVRYGKNLKKLSTGTEGVAYTGVYAYWAKDVNGTVQMVKMASPLIVPYYTGKPFIEILDLSDKFDNAPTVAQLTTLAGTYLGTGEPDISYEAEIERGGIMESLNMGDTVRIIDPPLDLKARVYETTYDPMAERMTSVKIGAYRPTIYDMILER